MAAGDSHDSSGTIEITDANAYTIGTVYQLNSGGYAVAMQTAAANAACLFKYRGIIECVKDNSASSATALLDEVYVNGSGEVTGDPTGNTLLNAVALEVTADAATSVKIELFGAIPPTAT